MFVCLPAKVSLEGSKLKQTVNRTGHIQEGEIHLWVQQTHEEYNNLPNCTYNKSVTENEEEMIEKSKVWEGGEGAGQKQIRLWFLQGQMCTTARL